MANISACRRSPAQRNAHSVTPPEHDSVSNYPTLFEKPSFFVDPVAGQEIQRVDEYGPDGREAVDTEIKQVKLRSVSCPRSELGAAC
jgi:hypothetical protein